MREALPLRRRVLVARGDALLHLPAMTPRNTSSGPPYPTLPAGTKSPLDGRPWMTLPSMAPIVGHVTSEPDCRALQSEGRSVFG